MSNFSIEFWKPDVEDYYKQVLINLMIHGYTEEEAIELLEELYHKTGEEYGG